MKSIPTLAFFAIVMFALKADAQIVSGTTWPPFFQKIPLGRFPDFEELSSREQMLDLIVPEDGKLSVSTISLADGKALMEFPISGHNNYSFYEIANNRAYFISQKEAGKGKLEISITIADLPTGKIISEKKVAAADLTDQWFRVSFKNDGTGFFIFPDGYDLKEIPVIDCDSEGNVLAEYSIEHPLKASIKKEFPWETTQSSMMTDRGIAFVFRIFEGDGYVYTYHEYEVDNGELVPAATYQIMPEDARYMSTVKLVTHEGKPAVLSLYSKSESNFVTSYSLSYIDKSEPTYITRDLEEEFTGKFELFGRYKKLGIPGLNNIGSVGISQLASGDFIIDFQINESILRSSVGYKAMKNAGMDGLLVIGPDMEMKQSFVLTRHLADNKAYYPFKHGGKFYVVIEVMGSGNKLRVIDFDEKMEPRIREKEFGENPGRHEIYKFIKYAE